MMKTGPQDSNPPRCELTTPLYMFYNCKADYLCLTCQVSLPPALIFSCYTWYSPAHPPHTLRPCPLSGFRLMTSDSPLRGASCLQSAVRLLVIIFQSVTLVSASWQWERREDGAPAGWMGEAGSKGRGQGVMFGVGQCCVYVCSCV